MEIHVFVGNLTASLEWKLGELQELGFWLWPGPLGVKSRRQLI
jgi:hypothetical protein